MRSPEPAAPPDTPEHSAPPVHVAPSSNHHRHMTRNGDGLATLLRQYVASRRHTGPASFLEFLRRRNPHVFSHHECTRPDYLDHVWSCCGLHVCRGCTVVLLTTVATLVAGLTTRWPVAISTPTLAAIFTGLLLLSLVPLREAPRTVMHDLRRAALGVLLGSAASYLILADQWLPRAIVVAVYLAVLVARRVVRGASTQRSTRSPSDAL